MFDNPALKISQEALIIFCPWHNASILQNWPDQKEVTLSKH